MSTNLSSFFEQVFNEATALEVYQQTHAGKLPMGVFLGLLKLDPTAIVAEGENEEVALNGSKKGAYTDWLVRQYKAAGEGAQARFLTEDAAQIRKYLEVYKALTTNKEGVAKLQRSVEQQGLQIANIKDLNQFKLASLAQVLTPFMKESSEDLAVREENKIQLSTMILFGKLSYPSLTLLLESLEPGHTGAPLRAAPATSTTIQSRVRSSSLELSKFRGTIVGGSIINNLLSLWIGEIIQSQFVDSF